MNSRTAGVEDALFGALFALYLVYVVPFPPDVPELNFAFGIAALAASLGLFATGLQLSLANVPRKPLVASNWLWVFACTVAWTLVIPVVLHTFRPVGESPAYLPLPIIMGIWLTVRLIDSPSDGDGGPPDWELVALVVLAEGAIVSAYAALRASLDGLALLPMTWVIQALVGAISLSLAYASRTRLPSASTRGRSPTPGMTA